MYQQSTKNSLLAIIQWTYPNRFNNNQQVHNTVFSPKLLYNFTQQLANSQKYSTQGYNDRYLNQLKMHPQGHDKNISSIQREDLQFLEVNQNQIELTNTQQTANKHLKQKIRTKIQYYKNILKKLQQKSKKSQFLTKQIMIGRMQNISHVQNQNADKKQQAIQQIDKFHNCNRYLTSFLDIQNKMISRRHAIIRFPIFKYHHQSNISIYPSFYCKLFKQELPSEIMFIIRSFLIPEMSVLITDLSSKYGLYRKVQDIVLIVRKFEYPYVIGYENKTWKYNRKIISQMNQSLQSKCYQLKFAHHKCLPSKQEILKDKGFNILEERKQIIQIYKNQLQNQTISQKNRNMLHEDTQIYFQMSTDCVIRISQLLQHKTLTIANKYAKQIRKKITQRNQVWIDHQAVPIRHEVYFVQGFVANPQDQVQQDQSISTIIIDIARKQSLVSGNNKLYEYSQTYILFAHNKNMQTNFSIGRHSSNDIKIHSQDVSRRHCQIIYQRFKNSINKGRWRIIDLNSRNGIWTKVNRIKQPCKTILQKLNLYSTQENIQQMKKYNGQLITFKVGEVKISLKLKLLVNQIHEKQASLIRQNKEQYYNQSNINNKRMIDPQQNQSPLNQSNNMDNILGQLKKQI